MVLIPGNSLERHWNGALLTDVNTALQWTQTMTWKGLHPIVQWVTTTYERGKRISRQAFAPLAQRLQRSQTLPHLERPDRTATSRSGARGIETGSYGARHRFVARTSVVRPHCRRSARNRPLRATVGPTWGSMAGKEDWAATVSRPSKLSLAAQSRIPAMLTQEWVCW